MSHTYLRKRGFLKAFPQTCKWEKLSNVALITCLQILIALDPVVQGPSLKNGITHGVFGGLRQ